MASHCPTSKMETATQVERRAAIVSILRQQQVGRQADLVRILRKLGHEATQSSVSRDLRELGVLKAGHRYLLPGASANGAADADADAGGGDFERLAHFVREIRTAGPTLTVLKTATGAAQSVAIAIDRAHWPELVGTLSGDDTIFLATGNARQQRRVLTRLHSVFPA
jgi:transcriptional regulator of arginine metabolism